MRKIKFYLFLVFTLILSFSTYGQFQIGIIASSQDQNVQQPPYESPYLLEFDVTQTFIYQDSLTNRTPIGFDVTRNLVATYIEDGIVKDAFVYGEELITNGTFDTDLSGWTADAWWSWVSGEAYHTSSSDYKPLSQNPSVVNGKTYKLVFDLTTLGDVKVRYQDGASQNIDNVYSTSGTKEIVISDIKTNTDFYFSRSIGTAEFSIDNVSVKELIYTDVARIQDGGVMVEEEAENLLPYSEDFTHTDWFKADVTVTLNSTEAPNGTLTASLLVNADASQNMRYDLTVSENTNYVFSFYVKNIDCTDLRYSVYDLTTGQAGDIIGKTSYFSQVSTSEWTRVEVAFTTPSGADEIGVYPTRDSSSGDFYVWGAQTELGSVSTSYVTTTGTAVTRPKDSISITPPTLTKSINEWIYGVKQPSTYDIPSIYEMKDGTSKVTMSDELFRFDIDSTEVKEGYLTSVTGSDFTVIRNSTANQINSLGIVEEAPYNLITSSEDFSNASWFKTEIGITPNSTTYNGKFASKITPSTTSSRHEIRTANINIQDGSVYTITAIVKSVGYDYFQIIPSTGLDDTFSAYGEFDLANGVTLGSVFIDSHSIADLGNGWYECTVITTADGNSTVGAIYFAIAPTDTSRRPSFVGDATSGIYVYSTQIELGSVATDYQATTDRMDFPRVDYSEGIVVDVYESILDSIDDHVTMSNGTAIYTKNSSNSFDLEVTVQDDLSVRPTLKVFTDDYVTGVQGKISFTVTNLTGTCLIRDIHTGATERIDYYVTNGYNEINFTSLGSTNAVHVYFNSAFSLFNIEVTDFNIELATSQVWDGNPKVLVENEVESLTRYSEDFSNIQWYTGRAVITTDSILAPNNTLTADYFVCNETSDWGSYLGQEEGFSEANIDLTFSCFVKAGNNTDVNLLATYSGNTISSWFDLSNGTTGSNRVTSGTNLSYVNHTIESYPNDWYRISMTVQDSQFATAPVFRVATCDGDDDISCTINDDLFVWGGQIEVGKKTSYFPSLAGTSTTRPKDSISVLVPTNTSSITDIVNGVETKLTNIPATFIMQDGTTSVTMGDGVEPYKDLVINGRFDGLTGWMAHNLATISTSERGLKLIADGTAFRSLNNFTLIGGTTYILNFDIELGTGNFGDVYDGDNSTYIVSASSITTSGNKTFEYTPTANTTSIRFYQRNSGVVYYDNILITEIPEQEIYPQDNSASRIGEVDAVTGWVNSGAVPSVDTTEFFKGGSSVKAYASSIGYRDCIFDIPMIEGYKYIMNFASKQGVLAGNVLNNVQVRLVRPDGNRQDYNVPADNSWHEQSLEVVSNVTGTGTIRLYASNNLSVGEAEFWTDNISVTEIPSYEIYPTGDSASKYAPESGVGDWDDRTGDVALTSEIVNGDNVLKITHITGTSRGEYDFSVIGGSKYIVSYDAREYYRSFAGSWLGFDDFVLTNFTDTWAKYSHLLTATSTATAKIRMYPSFNYLSGEYLELKNFSIIDLDDDYTAVLTEATTNGYTLPSIEQILTQNQFILDLKAEGIWDEEDAIYVFANNGSKEFGSIDWKDPTREATITGNITWSSTGYKGTGISGDYLNTNFTPSTDATNWTYDEHSMTFYSPTEATVSASGFPNLGGVLQGADNWYTVYQQLSDGAIYYHVSDQTWSVFPYQTFTGVISLVGSEIATNRGTLFIGGVEADSETIARAGTNSTTIPFFLFASNDDGTDNYNGNAEIGFWSIGGAQTSLQATKSTLIENYMIEISSQ